MTHPDDARATQISAYFDGELDETARVEFEASLASDPELRAMLDDFARLQTAFRADLEQEMSGVPDARFEQVWDEIDRAISQPDAVTDAPATFMERLSAGLSQFLGGWRAPAAAAIGACAVAFVVLKPGADAPEGQGALASGASAATVGESANVGEAATRDAAAAPASESLEGLAKAPVQESEATSFPVVAESDATIEKLEASGANVQVDRLDEGPGRAGTVVIFVEELDEEEAATGGFEL